MKSPHKKIKNTGIIFELLSRQLTGDLMTSENSKAFEIIQKHFNSKSELIKEFKLYESLLNQKFSNEKRCEEFVTALVEVRKKLDNKKLKNEKYKLLSEIKDTYGLETFFNTRLANFRLYASISNLLEHAIGNDIEPVSLIKSKELVVEHVNNIKQESKLNELSDYQELSNDLKLLSQRLLIEKFNNKYSTALNESQIKLLKQYINNLTDTTAFKQFINEEITNINTQIKKISSKIDDDVIKIKLNEIKSNLKQLVNEPITDRILESMMLYYELISEVEKQIK